MVELEVIFVFYVCRNFEINDCFIFCRRLYEEGFTILVRKRVCDNIS